MRHAQRLLALTLISFLAFAAHAADATRPLVDLTSPEGISSLKPSSDQVSFAADGDGVLVTIKPGPAGYPGFVLKPEAGPWDLSEFGHIALDLENPNDTSVIVNLRVDGEGHWSNKPWNTERFGLDPGQSKTGKVVFGYTSGGKKGYPLDSSKVTKLLIFSGKIKDKPLTFRIKSIHAGGEAGEKPPVDPRSVRIKPTNGYIVGGETTFAPDKQLKLAGGASAEQTDEGVVLTFPGSEGRESVAALVPPMGRWNLSTGPDAFVKLTNLGDAAVTPAVQFASGRHERTDIVAASSPLAPGESVEIHVPFVAANSIVLPSKTDDKAKGKIRPVEGTGTTYKSDKTNQVRLTVKDNAAAKLRVDSIRIGVLPSSTPDWLGQRPPVDGEWVKTLDDNFDGDTIDSKTWNVRGPNFWGKKNLTHWSKDQVTVSDGMATIRLEQKEGWHNDDPESKHRSPYAGGFLDTYGRWTQLYGYFETRVKLPTADGVWPAFWMMPDRGTEAGPQWKRQSTNVDGMEFDILEHLTRWGPYRYTTAMHWDGYGKDHKATGGGVYFRPDADGFVTAGCLWLPNTLVYYCNGEEVARWETDRITSVPMCMIFTMPIGGWDNDELDDAQLPADFVVDYVRVWQRKDLVRTEDGHWETPAGW